MMYLSAAVEGDLDAAIIRRLARDAGVAVRLHVKGGKSNVRGRIASYNQASKTTPFLVLVDLDRDFDCAPQLIEEWLPGREPTFCFRVAVRAAEAWLLGDPERLARFLRVPQAAVSAEPETLLDPKRALIAIAGSSRSAAIREDIVPRPGSGRAVGPAYTSRMIDFAASPEAWRPEVAAEACDSLRRARQALLAVGVTYNLNG